MNTRVDDDLIYLRAAGVSVLLDVSERRLPRIAHWGLTLATSPRPRREPWSSRDAGDTRLADWTSPTRRR
ncbi:hypothetical protein GCM10025873_08000 [Demequina sediminis]|nr:hypothetical protein GCM10025873_08000 [Demequina sediminis]